MSLRAGRAMQSNVIQKWISELYKASVVQTSMTCGLEVIAQIRLRLMAAASRGVAVCLVLSSCGVTRRFDEVARWVVIRISLLSTYGALAALICAFKRPFSSPAWSQRRPRKPLLI